MQGKDEAFGRQSKYYISRAKYIIYFDEEGGNTSQSNDRNADGEQIRADKDRKAVNIPCKDSHFTVLGLTLANEEPLCMILPNERVRCGSENWHLTLV